MLEDDLTRLIQQYAGGEITWHALREPGFDNDVQVLRALGELGFRLPIAPMQGPNMPGRERGCAHDPQRADGGSVIPFCFSALAEAAS